MPPAAPDPTMIASYVFLRSTWAGGSCASAGMTTEYRSQESEVRMRGRDIIRRDDYTQGLLGSFDCRREHPDATRRRTSHSISNRRARAAGDRILFSAY